MCFRVFGVLGQRKQHFMVFKAAFPDFPFPIHCNLKLNLETGGLQATVAQLQTQLNASHADGGALTSEACGARAQMPWRMVRDASPSCETVWQCTERTESAQKCKREEGESMRDRVGEGQGRGLQALPGAESGAAVGP